MSERLVLTQGSGHSDEKSSGQAGDSDSGVRASTGFAGVISGTKPFAGLTVCFRGFGASGSGAGSGSAWRRVAQTLLSADEKCGFVSPFGFRETQSGY